MTALAFWLLAAFGAAYIVGHSSISLRPRAWLAETIGEKPVELVECPACFGTWLGLLGGALLPFTLTGGLLKPEYFTGSFPLTKTAVLGALLVACATAGGNYLLARLTGLVRPEEPDYPESWEEKFEAPPAPIRDSSTPIQELAEAAAGKSPALTPEEHLEREMAEYGDEEDLADEDDGAEGRWFKVIHKDTGALAFIACHHLETVHEYYPPEAWNILEESRL